MKALNYPDFNQLEIIDVPEPMAGPNEVVLNVGACGICGSELETFKNQSPRRKPPLVMGHEFCGTIDSIGAHVENWHVGDAVVSNSLVPCNDCKRCERGDTHLCANRQIFGMHRSGAFAQKVVVPAHCLLDWPVGLDKAAACLAEPLANGLHMVNLTSHLKPKNVLVIGAGPIGLMAAQSYKVVENASVWIADINQDRLDVALTLDLNGVVNVKETDAGKFMRSVIDDEGPDIVIDAVGSSVTNKMALATVRPGGAVVVIGLHEDTRSFQSYEITLPEKQVIGTYAATMDELRLAIELLHSGEIETKTWVHEFSLEEGVSAFRRMLAANDKDIKAVLIP